MPTNNPGACSNCNIQNSNPSITDNTSTNTSVDSNKAASQKRYNPGALLNANVNTNTNSAISAVQTIGAQSRFDQGPSSQQKKSVQTANQTTLNILKNVIDVQSEIVNVDKSSQKMRKTARQSSSKSLNASPTTNKSQTVLATLKATGRTEKVITKDQTQKKKQNNNQKNRTRNKKAKSVGTDLASSVSFKAKFAVLLQQNIATENPTIDYEIPSTFDGRKVWVDYISDARSQGVCGSCWAFSSIFALATRLSIYSREI